MSPITLPLPRCAEPSVSSSRLGKSGSVGARRLHGQHWAFRGPAPVWRGIALEISRCIAILLVFSPA